MARKKTIQQLLKRKKELQRASVITEEMQKEISDIDHQIDQKTNQSDQNYFRTFFKTAKELLPNDAFNKLEGIASTRQNNYQSGTK
jgi:hypothetical protein